MVIIDIHPHVISSDLAKYPRAPVGGLASDWSQARPVSYQQMLAEIARAGIAKSVLVQASTCYGHDNSYVADAVAAAPQRFTGVFSADLREPDAPQTLKYWMTRGLRGLRLFMTEARCLGKPIGWMSPALFRHGRLPKNTACPCAYK